MSKSLKYTLYGILILDIIGILLSVPFSSTLLMDNLEHLRMSYLVSQGYVPYRDFFEHHHPLLWYMFAPFMKILPHNIITVLFIARFSALIARVIMFYFIYLIFKRFFGDGTLILYFMLIVFSFYPIWYGFSYFKPDVFELLFFFIGLYLFFMYMHSLKIIYLIASALCFMVSFLFLQTAIFSILPLSVILIYFAKKNPKVTADILIASVLPILILSGIALYMYENEVIRRYYDLNWTFNRNIFDLCDDFIDFSSVIPYYIVQLFMGIVSLMWVIKKDRDNKYVQTVGLLYIFSIAEHTFFVTTNAHYLILTLIYCSMIIAPVMKQIFCSVKKQSKNRAVFYIFSYLFVYIIFNFTGLWLWNNNELFRNRKIFSNYDKSPIVNIDNTYKFIWNKHVSYYEMRNTLHKVDDYLFHTHPEYDINEQIKQYKPEYLEYDVTLAQKHQRYKIKNGRFEISLKNLQEYEQIYPNLWRRKDTFSQ
ncbi:MAG: hypothetical protein IJ532_04935 [Alphaproteobacteria bacterium]|nr:hypothetical protein [Alphaproteobacteria bacterium]